MSLKIKQKRKNISNITYEKLKERFNYGVEHNGKIYFNSVSNTKCDIETCKKYKCICSVLFKDFVWGVTKTRKVYFCCPEDHFEEDKNLNWVEIDKIEKPILESIIKKIK
jgi:hypothetical protein